MKWLFFLPLLLLSTLILNAQQSPAPKIDSIFFHLYTDSLKKGQHNYINVDGKLSDGTWMPLTAKEIEFTTSDGKFEGNELVIPPDFKPEKVVVKAVLRSNPSLKLEKQIWIKKMRDPDKLPTNEDVIRDIKRTKKNNL